MASFSFKTLAENLLTLEINTIIKADMTGNNMPTNRREALLDIAKDYHYKLVELNCREPCVWDAAGIMAFLELRQRAIAGARTANAELKQETDAVRYQTLKEMIIMLNRIQSQSELIVSMFIKLARAVNLSFNLDEYREIMAERVENIEDFLPHDDENRVWNNDLSRARMQELDDLALDASDISMIRKIWEIGTERVVLQTVIHADGDITTRIAERLLYNPDPILFQIHNESVQGAVNFWTGLVDTIGKMAGSLLGSKLK